MLPSLTDDLGWQLRVVGQSSYPHRHHRIHDAKSVSSRYLETQETHKIFGPFMCIFGRQVAQKTRKKLTLFIQFDSELCAPETP